MSILFKNALLITMKDDEKPFIGDLRVTGNKISHIAKDLEVEPDDSVIQCNGNILMPGFKNAHGHTAMVFGRGLTDTMSLQDWLYNEIFPMESHLEKGNIYHLTKAGILEYIQNGITGVCDMYLNCLEQEKAFKEMGFRASILTMPEDEVSWMTNPKFAIEKINQKDDLIKYVVGLHAEYTSNEERLQKLSEFIKKYKLPAYIHNSETEFEVEECKKRHHGLTPTELFDSLGIYDYGGAGYHSIVLSEHDIEIYKKKNIFVVTNPSSNSKLKSGICPLKKYIDSGLKIAIGTDGATSNDSLDMFKEMVTACFLSNFKEHVNPKDIVQFALSSGAEAIGFKDADCLDIGKLADIVMLDTSMPNMHPINDIFSLLVYGASNKNVCLTMINGNILYRDGVFYLKDNIKDILYRADEITKKLLKFVKN